ncbi:MAG: AI-2E family transporter [Alphaproteobacteria bacterium]
MTRRSISLLVAGGVLVAVLVIAPDVPLVVFAGILLGLFLRGGGDWIAARLKIGQMLGMAAFVLTLVLIGVAIALLAAPLIAVQFDELMVRIPAAAEGLMQQIRQYPWGEDLLAQLRPEGMLRTGGAGVAAAAATTFGAFGHVVVILIVGIYMAINPGLYLRGVRQLFAPSLRPRAEEVMHATASTLRRWLAAQILAMTTVGVLSWIGLWILGIPLAPMLGLIAGLFAFIPNVGPILSMIPGVLLALPMGTETVIWTVGVYMAVQAIETYLVTPIVQREMVALPPALTITVQILLGVLFGIFGLMLATPIAAACMTLTRMLYVDYLDGEPGAKPAKAARGK